MLLSMVHALLVELDDRSWMSDQLHPGIQKHPVHERLFMLTLCRELVDSEELSCHQLTNYQHIGSATDSRADFT